MQPVGLDMWMIALPRRTPTAGRWCLSRQWTAGDCHRAGRRHWSRDCCGHRTHGLEPGKRKTSVSYFNVKMLHGDLGHGCIKWILLFTLVEFRGNTTNMCCNLVILSFQNGKLELNLKLQVQCRMIVSAAETPRESHMMPKSVMSATWLTLGWEQGKENKCTLPKSSAEANRDPSCDLHVALMSVPSAPSGHIPGRDRGSERQKHGQMS